MFDLRGEVMDPRVTRDGCCEAPHAVKPGAAWILAVVIGVILGAAALVASLSTDTRDFAAKHQSVLKSRVI